MNQRIFDKCLNDDSTTRLRLSCSEKPGINAPGIPMGNYYSEREVVEFVENEG